MNEEQQQIDEKLLRDLRDLNNDSRFQTWRENVCKPILDQLEADLSVNADSMPEMVLRAKVKHYFSKKYEYYQVFEIAKLNLKDTK